MRLRKARRARTTRTFSRTRRTRRERSLELRSPGSLPHVSSGLLRSRPGADDVAVATTGARTIEVVDQDNPPCPIARWPVLIGEATVAEVPPGNRQFARSTKGRKVAGYATRRDRYIGCHSKCDLIWVEASRRPLRPLRSLQPLRSLRALRPLQPSRASRPSRPTALEGMTGCQLGVSEHRRLSEVREHLVLSRKSQAFHLLISVQESCPCRSSKQRRHSDNAQHDPFHGRPVLLMLRHAFSPLVKARWIELDRKRTTKCARLLVVEVAMLSKRRPSSPTRDVAHLLPARRNPAWRKVSRAVACSHTRCQPFMIGGDNSNGAAPLVALEVWLDS